MEMKESKSPHALFLFAIMVCISRIMMCDISHIISNILHLTIIILIISVIMTYLLHLWSTKHQATITFISDAIMNI